MLGGGEGTYGSGCKKLFPETTVPLCVHWPLGEATPIVAQSSKLTISQIWSIWIELENNYSNHQNTEHLIPDSSEHRTVWVSSIQMVKSHELAENSNTGDLGL